MSAAGGASGSIYDLGYQGYHGPRLGRPAVALGLLIQTLRAAYGIGRGGRAKIVPFLMLGLSVLPAILAVGIAALAAQAGAGSELDDASPIRHDTYQNLTSTLVMLFCAAQAPELFGRDQRHGVLSLYFARALRRSDYAIARLAGFILALVLLQLLPNLVMFFGRVLVSEDIVEGFRREAPSILPALTQIGLSSALMGGLAMVVSAFTPRRAYATAGIIALFLVPSIVAGVVTGLGSSGIGEWLVLLSPTSALDGTNAVLFDQDLGQEFFFVSLPDWAYLADVVVGIVASLVVSVRRFVRIAT
jgi:ABC-2 type transport system permease protein